MKKIFILLCFLLCSWQLQADNLSDSNRMFDWAEENYPQYFYPVGAATFPLEGYLVRYYAGSNTYVGTAGENVYIYGDMFGGLQYVGQIGDFVDTSDVNEGYGECVENYPELACTDINDGGAGLVSSQFIPNASCDSAFPDLLERPVPPELGLCAVFPPCGACGVFPVYR